VTQTKQPPINPERFSEPTVQLFGPVSDSDALFMEGELIKSLGRWQIDGGGTLVNHYSGAKNPDKSAARRAVGCAKMRGKKLSPEHIAKREATRRANRAASALS
jgi:hypothetical protein